MTETRYTREELLEMLCRTVKEEDDRQDETTDAYSTQAALQEKIDLYLDFYRQILQVAASHALCTALTSLLH